MAEIVHFASSAPLEDICAQLDEDAAVIVDGVVSEHLLDAVRAELDPYLRGVAHGRNDFAGFETKRIGALIARSLSFGAGPHYCLGAGLAWAELEEAFCFLAPKMQGLRLGGEIGWGSPLGIYDIVSLPLTFSTRGD